MEVPGLLSIGIYRSDLHYSKQIVYPKNRQWQELKAGFEGIVRLVKYYEMKEATTLSELALWKAKIDQTDDEVNPTSMSPYGSAWPN